MVLQETTYITVSMPQVTGTLTGGSPLLSYNLQYRGDSTPPTDWTTLVGEAPDSLTLQYSKNGLLTDKVYQFKYRVKNKFGWGPYSDFVAIRTAKVPD